MRRSLWFAGLWFLCAVPAVHAGYTHYWTWTQKPDPAALRACVANMKRVISARRGILAGVDGEGAPSVTATEVMFNGKGEEDSHEPFHFPGRDLPGAPMAGFRFVKTNGKPYDEVVTACLIVARDHFPLSVLKIDSDGGWEDWQHGAKLYAEVFGRDPKNPFTGEATSGPSSGGAGGGGFGTGNYTVPLLIVAVAVFGTGALFLLRRFNGGCSLTIRANAKGITIAGAVSEPQRQMIAEYLMKTFPATHHFTARASWRPGRPGLLVTSRGDLSAQEQRHMQIFLIMELGL